MKQILLVIALFLGISTFAQTAKSKNVQLISKAPKCSDVVITQEL